MLNTFIKDLFIRIKPKSFLLYLSLIIKSYYALL